MWEGDRHSLGGLSTGYLGAQERAENPIYSGNARRPLAGSADKCWAERHCSLLIQEIETLII